MVIDWIAMKNPLMTSFPIIPNSSPREWIWIFFSPPFSYLYNPAIIFSKVFCVLAAFFAGYGMRWPQSNINFEDFSLFFPPPPLSCGFNGKCLRSMNIFEMVVNINGSSFIHQVTPFFARPPTLSAHPHVFTTKRIYRYQSDRGRCKMALARVAIRDVSRFLKPSKWELKRRESFTFSVRLFFII